VYYILRKLDISSLYICPPHLYTAATVPWEIQKVIFNIIIHTPDYLRHLRRKQTAAPLTTTPEERHRTTL